MNLFLKIARSNIILNFKDNSIILIVPLFWQIIVLFFGCGVLLATCVNGIKRARGPGRCLVQSATKKERNNQPSWVWADCDYSSGRPKPITTKPPTTTAAPKPLTAQNTTSSVATSARRPSQQSTLDADDFVEVSSFVQQSDSESFIAPDIEISDFF